MSQFTLNDGLCGGGHVLSAPDRAWTPAELKAQVSQWRDRLREFPELLSGHASVGLLLDNGPHWIALDLACSMLGVAVVPLPDFFTVDQQRHLVSQAQVGVLLTTQADKAAALGFSVHGIEASVDSHDILIGHRAFAPEQRLPEGVHKITFTSGTTGQPKGVCLSLNQQMAVANALKQVTAPLNIRRHLCLLPMSVLLENIAGIYAPLLSDADIACPPLAETGLKGASSFDAQQCLDTIGRYQAESVILLPQMLFSLLQATSANDVRVRSLKFIAVGGGKVPPSLLAWASQLKLPVFEGYGLSECASVVCLNTPEFTRAGTVGKPLPGVSVKLADDGEILVRGRGYMGYLHELQGQADAQVADEWLPTGDLGTVDTDGFVSINGRKKNLIITGFGRNVSPEWPESLLLATGLFLQAMVMGDGQEQLSAVLVPRMPMNDDTVDQALATVNAQLPDYARIGQRVMATEPFTFDNGMATANGRIRRDAIARHYSGVFA